MTDGRESKLIDEELVCADSLVHHLNQVCGHQDVGVVQETNDPPDFWLHIDGKRFAVEVTSIVTDQGYLAHCRKLVQAIQQKAQETSDLNGKYALIVERNPKLPKRGSPDWSKLINSSVSVINSTKEALSTEVNYLQQYYHGRLGIQKLSGEGKVVGLCCFPGFKWEGEMQEELAKLIQCAVSGKRSKLEKKGVPQQCSNCILVLYDAYGCGDPDDARVALQKVQGYDWFHSIFWSASFADRTNELYPENPGRVGCFLYSREDEWGRETS